MSGRGGESKGDRSGDNRAVHNTIIVFGVTGQIGSSVGQSLLSAGAHRKWRVTVVMRKRDSRLAWRWRKLDARVHYTDMCDARGCRRLFRGAHTVVFLTDASSVAGRSKAAYGELAQGNTVVSEAKRAGVQHLLYSSIAHGGGDTEGVSMLQDKRTVEGYCRDSGIPYTIVQPVFLMDNFNHADMCRPSGGKIRLPIPCDRSLQMVAVRDVADALVMAANDPAQYANRTLQIAGDELTPEVMAKVFSAVNGRPLRAVRAPGRCRLRLHSKPYAKYFAWLNDTGFSVDIAACRARQPTLRTFQTWLVENGWDVADVGACEGNEGSGSSCCTIV